MGYRGALREYAAVWELVLRVADVAAVVLSGWLAGLIYLGDIPHAPRYILGLLLSGSLCLTMFPVFNLYRAWRGNSLGEEIQALTLAWLATLATLTFLAFITKTGDEFSRGWFFIWLGLGWLLLVLGRVVLRSLLHALRRRGFNQRRLLVVGSQAQANMLSARLAGLPWTGLSVAGVFLSARLGQSQALAVCEERDLAELAALVQSSGVDQVWIMAPLQEATMIIRRVQYALRHATVDVRYVPDTSSFELLNQSVTEVAGFPVISLNSSGMSGMDWLVKMVEDRVLAAVILLLISPLMLLIAAGVKLSSPGPALFRQRRLGLGGEEIMVLKFRSMVVHAEAPGSVTQASKTDGRVTPFGAFLRRTSLDELPQFLNVLCGEMSIVGPRPHALEHNEQYKGLVDKYMLRHKVKPGITGWAQVNGYRGETDTLEKMQRRVAHDLHYLQNWSLWLDLKIIALTVVRGFINPNAY
jgi:putative colanic acid biosynthesis UDP-glucose lipid carrier transferase